MTTDLVPRRLNDLADSTRDALERLERADEADQRRRELESLHTRFHALRQLEASHIEPLLLSQTETRGIALACQKARSRVTPLLDELDLTPVQDPGFERVLGRFARALRFLLDRTRDLLSNLDRFLSPEHRQLLTEALDQSEPLPC